MSEYFFLSLLVCLLNDEYNTGRRALEARINEKVINVTNRFPQWLKKRVAVSDNFQITSKLLASLKLNTVCQSAMCPNIGECFNRKTASFMILGNNCTRSCSFCAVEKGIPAAVDTGEPQRVAEAIEKLGIRHVVITSVTRDDLPDGGAWQFAACINVIRHRTPEVIIEVLTPDFGGLAASIMVVAAAAPDIFNHNPETVPRLYATVRPQADYRRSLSFLERVTG